MVTIANKELSAPNTQSPLHTPWRLVGRFQTLEPAQRLMEQLEREGKPCRLSLLDGLAVIARQSTDPAAQ